jgi:carbon storage regulator
MLVLSRKKNESIVINDDITIVVVEIRGDKVRLGIDAPKEIPDHRREVFDALHRADHITEQKVEEPSPTTKSGEPCPKCGQALLRVIWRTGKLSQKKLDGIRAGTAILGVQDEKGPRQVCLKCNPEWSQIHDLAMERRELQIKEKAAKKIVRECRKDRAKLRRQLTTLSEKLLRKKGRA